ncbi:MAG: hypothetical protein WC365_05050 [Candidatus Babeliales bacterium]|jgi:hypothetical protein
MMRKTSFVYAFIAVIAFGSALSAGSHQYSQKTYLAIRPHDINTAMEYTTWHRNAYTNHPANTHTHFQLVPFYQDSARSTDLGRYFGVGNGTNQFLVSTITPAPATLTTLPDINKAFLIHDWNYADAASDDDESLKGTAHFNPYQEAYGFRFDLFQNIEKPFKHFFFKLSTVLEQINQNVEMTVTNGQKENIEHGTPNSPYQFSLQDFFSGNVNVPAITGNEDLSENQQSPLTRAKIPGRRSKFGLADLDFGLGYKYLHAKNHAYISLDLTIPTGNRIRGEYLFEPVYGNGNHVGLGCSLDIGWELWASQRANIRLLWATRYRYLFENSEVRTLGIKNLSFDGILPFQANPKFSHYYLGGVEGQQNQPLFPLANELTRSCGIKPGNLFDTMIDFAFKSSGFSVDLGYNLYWKDSESIYLKNGQKFNDQNLVIADPTYQTQTQTLSIADHTALKKLTTDDLDLSTARTPSVLTNKLFGGFGYTFSIYEKHLCSVGIGGSYEFATNNSDLENYALWAKIGFSI